YTSHYMEEVQKLCKRIAILEAGKVLACDTLPHLLKLLNATIRFSGLPTAFADRVAAIPGVKTCEQGEVWKVTAEDASAVLSKLTRLTVESGIELTGISMREPTLEGVFLHLTGRELRD